MKPIISDDDARVVKAEKNGLSSFLSSRANFKTAAELPFAELPISTRALNRSFPQAFWSTTLVDTSVTADDPNNFCLSLSFKSSLSRLSISASFLGRDDSLTPSTNLPFKSTANNSMLALHPSNIGCYRPPALEEQSKNERDIGSYLWQPRSFLFVAISSFPCLLSCENLLHCLKNHMSQYPVQVVR